MQLLAVWNWEIRNTVLRGHCLMGGRNIFNQTFLKSTGHGSNRVDYSEAKTSCTCRHPTECKHEHKQGTLSGCVANTSTHQKTVLILIDRRLTYCYVLLTSWQNLVTWNTYIKCVCYFCQIWDGDLSRCLRTWLRARGKIAARGCRPPCSSRHHFHVGCRSAADGPSPDSIGCWVDW